MIFVQAFGRFFECDEARRGPELGPSARPGVSKDVAVRNAAGRDVSEARIPEYQEHLCGVRRLALGPARGSNTRLRRSAELKRYAIRLCGICIGDSVFSWQGLNHHNIAT